MTTAAKNKEEAVNESVITRHELEQLLDLAEKLQATFSQSARLMKAYFAGLIVEIVAFFIFIFIITSESMGFDFSNEFIPAIFSVSLIACSFTVFFIVMLARYRKRTQRDKANLQSVMDLVEEAQRQYAPQMSPVEKAVYGIRLRNLNFTDSGTYWPQGA